MILSLNKSAIFVMFMMNCSRTVAFELNLLDLSVYADNIYTGQPKVWAGFEIIQSEPSRCVVC